MDNTRERQLPSRLFGLVINKVWKTQRDIWLYLEGGIGGDWFGKILT